MSCNHHPNMEDVWHISVRSIEMTGTPCTAGKIRWIPQRNNQTLGLGFYEFFLFCEDIGAEPLPVISAGYDPHYLRAADMDEMRGWIDEAAVLPILMD